MKLFKSPGLLKETWTEFKEFVYQYIEIKDSEGKLVKHFANVVEEVEK